MKDHHWLDQYGSAQYAWQSKRHGDRTQYYRPLGFTEHSFDADGRYYEGRADMNIELIVETKTSLDNEQFRQRILLVWTALRCQHLLLQATAVHYTDLGVPEIAPVMDTYFAIDVPHDVDQAIRDAQNEILFLEDHFENIDPSDFSMHSQNTARVIDPKRALSTLFVYPTQPSTKRKSYLRLLILMSHAVADGSASFVWLRNLVHLLNRSPAQLRTTISDVLQPGYILQTLALPQEALYPPVRGSLARQRWFWLLTRILRHVRKPLPAGFPNPLLRSTPRNEPITLSPTYRPVLSYTTAPHLNGLKVGALADESSTRHLHRLCREANVSIGAGIFALVAVIMMEFYERRHPEIPLADRKPFIAGFPLNPRAFFNHTVDPNSLMLAFSDGIALPFLPSDTDLDGRIRLLARQAHRQLAAFQKRKRSVHADEEGLQYMGSRGAGRVLAMQYISSLERMGARLTDSAAQRNSAKIDGKSSAPPAVPDVQGAYPMTPNLSLQTCGISSIGRRDLFIDSGMYDLDAVKLSSPSSRGEYDQESRDLVADYRDFGASVRPREDEFLVGCSGTATGLGLGLSIDVGAIDPARVAEWTKRYVEILKDGESAEYEGGSKAKL